MKKIVVIIMLLVTVSGMLSQTKIETENWILGKLEKYGSEKYKIERGISYYNDYYDRKYQLDGKNLIYSYSYDTDDDYSSSKYYSGKIDEQYQATIPLWAIESVSLERDSYNYKPNLVFKLKNYCTECTYKEYWEIDEHEYRTVTYYDTKYGWGQNGQTATKVKKTRREKTGRIFTQNKSGGGKLGSSIRVVFSSSDPEEDFINRFNKAIKHLQTLYPKQPAKTETF